MSAGAIVRNQGEKPVFRDPNETAAREVSIKLLREILEFQRRLNHLHELARPEQKYLMNAYRKAIQVRRAMLRDLPDGARSDVL